MALEEDTDNPFGDESFGLEISVPGDADVEAKHAISGGSSLNAFDAMSPPGKTPDMQPEETGLMKADALSLDFNDVSAIANGSEGVSGQIPVAQIVQPAPAPAPAALVQSGTATQIGEGTSEGGAPKPKKFFGLCGCCSLEYFQQYFDVDTSDITERLLNIMNFCSEKKFLQLTYNNPDMYGPFWIATTLIFVLAVSSNLNAFFSQLEFSELGANSTSPTLKETWHYDIHKPTLAVSLVYIYVPCAGLGMWFLLQYLGINMPDAQTGAVKPLPLINTLCITGYSFLPYLPILMVCMVPFNALEMAALLLASVYSCAILFREIWPLIQASAPEGKACGRGKAEVVGMAVGAGFGIFSIICWFAFFF